MTRHRWIGLLVMVSGVAAASQAGAGCPPRSIWDTTCGSVDFSCGRDFGVAVDPYGNVLTAVTVGTEISVQKHSPGGALIWSTTLSSTTYGAVAAFDIATDSSGNVIIAGGAGAVHGSSWGVIALDIYLAKLDSGGNLLWSTAYNGPEELGDWALGVAADSGGAIAVCGVANWSAGSGDWLVSAYDAGGHGLWSSVYADSSGLGSAARKVVVDSSGAVYVAGDERSGSTDAPGRWLLRRYGAGGSVVWSVTAGGGPGTRGGATGLSLTAGPALVVGGNRMIDPEERSTLQLRWYDLAGNALREASLSCVTNMLRTSIAADAAGEVVVAAQSTGACPGLRRLNSSGSEIWSTCTDNTFEPWAVALDSSGRVAAAGPDRSTLGLGPVHTRLYDAHGPLHCYQGDPVSEEAAVFPNPVSGDVVSVGLPSLSADAAEVTVEVFNSAGQPAFRGVWRDVPLAQKAVTFSGILRWAPGVYTARARAKLVTGDIQEFMGVTMMVKR